MTRLSLVLLVVALSACVKHVPSRQVTPQTLLLLKATEERESDSIQERRVDLEFDVRDFERSPHVQTTGESAAIDVENAELRLYGDEAATRGFYVDNCIFLEVLKADGTPMAKAVIGYADGLLQGKTVIDALGRRSFSFEPGEINLAAILPERGVVKLRAAVLDYGGVAKNSDVYVKVTPRAARDEELQNQ